MNEVGQRIERHAEMANVILESAHTLCVTGHVDLRSNNWSKADWEYDWALLEMLLRHIPQMKSFSFCADEPHKGEWLDQKVKIQETLFGEHYDGILIVSRLGAALDRLSWDWLPAVEGKVELPPERC